jgi:2-oxoglutarate dehydrogenase E2 component (dihydrolipoamide succinyltransferase)
MPTDITVPTLGESVTEATIGRWFKKPGDPVKADEPLVELETDKVTLEVNAPASGTLGEIVAKDGETVGPGAVLGSIVDGGAGTAAAPAAKAPEPKPAPSEPKSAPAKPAEAPQAAPKPAASSANGPAVGRIAAETGLDPASVLGTGKDGRVTKGDMLSAPPGRADGHRRLQRPAAAPAPAQLRAPSAPDDAAREERVRMTKLRQTIARG